jgi:hypothetical protein
VLPSRFETGDVFSGVDEVGEQAKSAEPSSDRVDPLGGASKQAEESANTEVVDTGESGTAKPAPSAQPQPQPTIRVVGDGFSTMKGPFTVTGKLGTGDRGLQLVLRSNR